jgi:hypothetical protein
MASINQKISIFKTCKNTHDFLSKINQDLKIQQKEQVEEFFKTRNNILELQIMRNKIDLELNENILQHFKSLLDLLFTDITTLLEYKNEEFIQEIRKNYLN